MQNNQGNMEFKYKHSFANKISIYIISVITIIFILIILGFYNISKKRVIDSSIEYAENMVDELAKNISSDLNSVSQTINSTQWLISQNINDLPFIDSIIKHNIINNKLIIGSALAFEPNIKNGEDSLKMIYGFRKDNQIDISTINTESYYYPQMEWYSQTKQTKRGYWSEPYFDEGAGNIIMSTYAVPIFDKNNNVVAIYTADISLINYTDMVEHMLPFPDSYSFMISRSGLYITHRLKERILNETIFANAYANNNLDYESIGTAMTNGEKGYYLFDNDGFKSYAIFVPIENTWWSLCSVCKQDILISELKSFSYYIILIFIIGIALFYITIYLTIRHLTKPLEGFVHSATKIAHGDFNVKLPKIQSKDEMKGLRDSFDYMQKSLKKYIFELKETTATKERIESELSIAHDIQMGMIPKIFPPYPNRSDIDIFAILNPAKEVGGDLYDFFISNEKLYFAIGDVSGKGVPASLFMAISRSLFRTISNQTDSPKEIIGRMNSSISDQNESCMFITMFIGVLDLKKGILNYCNAGHNPPIIINNNEPAKYIEVKRNIPIGIMSDYIFTEEQIKINLNTKLICYTDGIIEAENNLQELYTDNNLFSLLDRNYKLPPKKLTNLILDDVRLHVNGAAQSDDLTLMIIEYK